MAGDIYVPERLKTFAPSSDCAGIADRMHKFTYTEAVRCRN